MSSETILVLAPLGRDGPLTKAALERAGLSVQLCGDLSELCAALSEAGAALLTQEALPAAGREALEACVSKQPAWSDIPLIVLGNVDLPRLTNVSVLERPVRGRLLVGTVQAALRARRRQYQVRDLLAELSQSVRNRDDFLAMLGHELRNPLAAIVTAADLMERRGHQGKEREIISRQSRNLARLVDDLLDVSRVTSGKVVLREERLDLRDLLRRIADAYAPRALLSKIQVETQLGDEPLVVHGDPLRLEQVIVNLLINGLKYGNTGGHVQLRLSREGQSVVLRVRDDGVGISPELLPRIFDLFIQAPGTMDRAQGGMGIGLTLAVNLVRLHGGTLEAHSDGLGRGSEFVLRLPRAAGESPAKTLPDKRGRGVLRVLLVEDGPDARDVLQLALEQMGHAVETSADGDSAVAAALRLRPDAMLVDLGLPGRDGFEVAKAVRSALGSGVRLVALTGYGQAADRERALAAGFDAFLVKPANLDAVEAALRD